MAKDIEVSWGGNVKQSMSELGDLEFYRSLPGMTEEMRSNIHGIPDYMPSRGPYGEQLVYLAGSAVLSSSILATAIKAYVALKKRKVIITIGDKKLEFEGSNLEHDQEAIEAMIDKLSELESKTSLTIYAER